MGLFDDSFECKIGLCRSIDTFYKLALTRRNHLPDFTTTILKIN